LQEYRHKVFGFWFLVSGLEFVPLFEELVPTGREGRGGMKLKTSNPKPININK